MKMGPVDLPPEVREAVDILKRKIQSTPVLVFPDFDKPILLETDASKEGLGAMLSQKQSDGHYHPVTFGSHSLMLSEKNYHTLKWSVTEHFKEYLANSPFMVQMDNNPLTCVLTTPNLDATGHWWVGMLASSQFKLKYQKGANNGTTDALSWVPISHSWETIQSLLEGAIVGMANRGEVRVSEELLEEHRLLSHEARVQAVKLVPMHIVDWAEAQEVDAVLAACHKWLCIRKDAPLPKWDALLKKCLGMEAETEQGKMLFCICNSLVLNKGLMYVNTTPKGETKGVLTFVVPVGQCCTTLNSVHCSHQGQQRTLALAQERFWWPMMAEDCRALVRGCLHC